MPHAIQQILANSLDTHCMAGETSLTAPWGASAASGPGSVRTASHDQVGLGEAISVEALTAMGLALVVLAAAAPAPAPLVVVGGHAHDVAKRLGDKRTWFANALRGMRLRYSLREQWSSDELRLALQAAVAMGAVQMNEGRICPTPEAARILVTEAAPLEVDEALAIAASFRPALHSLG